MAISEKIIDIYLGQDRQLTPINKGGKYPGKAPLEKNWTTKEFTKEEILKYAEKGHNLGFVLGDKDAVLDVDPRNGGDKSLGKLLRYLKITDLASYYPCVISGRGDGGCHYYFRLGKTRAKDLRTTIKKLKGLDLKTKGGQVIIPGSVHPETGKKYKFDSQSPFEEKAKPIKKKLLKLYLKSSSIPAQTHHSKPTGEVLSPKRLYTLLKCLPIADYKEHEDWLNIMMAAHSATNGRGLTAFLTWSLKDDHYAEDTGIITTRWNSLTPNEGITLRTLLKEVRRYKKNVNELLVSAVDFKDILSNEIEQQIVHRFLKTKYKSGKFIMHGADQRYWHYVKTHWELFLPNMVSRKMLNEIETYKLKNPDIKKGIPTLLTNSEKVLKATIASNTNLHRKKERAPSIINVKNGEIWIDDNTGEIELKKHSPKSHLTYCLDVKYNSKAACPRFDRALSEIFVNAKDKKEVIRHLWELIGYIIQTKKNIPIWILFQGYGSNGKTVVLNVISALLGEASLEKSISELDTNRNNHALADLPGKLAIIDEDISSGVMLPDGMLKKVSENKTLVANPKGSPTFRFENTAVVIMAANNWPRTRDLSDGMRRRAMVFQFKRRFKKEEADIQLADYIIKNELAGVLNQAIAGNRRLRERGYFLIPRSCKRDANIWFSSSSQIQQFRKDNLVKEIGERVLFMDVWERYRSWAFLNGINKPYPKMYFRKELIKLGAKIIKGSGNNWFLNGNVLKKRKEENL